MNIPNTVSGASRIATSETARARQEAGLSFEQYVSVHVLFELQHFPEPQSLSSRQLLVHFDTHSFVILQQINPSSQSTLESHRSRVVEYLMHTRNTKTTFNDKLDAILRSCDLTLLRLRLQLKMTFQKFYASYFKHVLLGRDNLHESPHGMLRKYARI